MQILTEAVPLSVSWGLIGSHTSNMFFYLPYTLRIGAGAGSSFKCYAAALLISVVYDVPFNLAIILIGLDHSEIIP
jgi:hypothetical protein